MEEVLSGLVLAIGVAIAVIAFAWLAGFGFELGRATAHKLGR